METELTRLASNALVAAVFFACACAPARRIASPDAAQPHSEIRQRADSRFVVALFGKPRPSNAKQASVPPVDANDTAGGPERLAPLFAVESIDPADANELPFSPEQHTAQTQPDGLHHTRRTLPAVYYAQSNAQVGQRTLRQWTYFWRFSDQAPTNGRLDGVRITLSEEGWPIVYELYAAEDGVVRLFVADSLEMRAAARHGPPLPGRAFAIEPALDKRPDVVVVRLVRDGPMPMGPWVYLAADGEVTTLLCRCSPSQVDGEPKNAWYELLPARRFESPLRPDWNDASWLENALRWPE